MVSEATAAADGHQQEQNRSMAEGGVGRPQLQSVGSRDRAPTSFPAVFGLRRGRVLIPYCIWLHAGAKGGEKAVAI